MPITESEKRIEKKLVKEVKKLGGLCLKLLPFSYTGLPDRLCLINPGIAIFVETKSQGDRLRPRQVYVHKLLRNLGFYVHVINSALKVDQFIYRVKLKQILFNETTQIPGEGQTPHTK
jgi:hypothetical protein